MSENESRYEESKIKAEPHLNNNNKEMKDEENTEKNQHIDLLNQKVKDLESLVTHYEYKRLKVVQEQTLSEDFILKSNFRKEINE